MQDRQFVLTRQYSVAEVQSIRNVTIVQLEGEDPGFPNLVPYSTAHQKGWVTITELPGIANVPQVLADNQGGEMILLLAGEVLLGAKQDRTVNTTILLPQYTKTVIPVSCVERGRWSDRSREFSPSGTVVSPEMRASLSKSVAKNVRYCGSFNSDQAEVWNQTFARIVDTRVEAPTESYEEFARFQRRKMKDSPAEFHPHPRATGIAGFVNGTITGFDLLPNPLIFAGYFSRFVESYAVDLNGGEEKPKGPEYYTGFVNHLLTEIENAGQSSHPSPGVGETICLDGARITGSALVYGPGLVHLQLFNKK
jgi:hypothetical protein